MPFIFVELNDFSSSQRYALYQSTPQSVEEILLYYLAPICPSKNYQELPNILSTMQEGRVKDKMQELLPFFESPERRDTHFAYSGDATIIGTYKVKPPTDRLGGLFSSDKLTHVLAGMDEGVKLPPITVKRTPADTNFDYEIIDGIHRYYSSVKNGLALLPVTITGS